MGQENVVGGVARGIAFLAVLLLCAGVIAAELVPPAKKSPDFTLVNIKDGRQVRLSDFRGKVVLLDFWATWCIPCRKSLRFYQDLFRRKHNEGFVVIAVSIDRSAKRLRRYLQRRPVSYWVLHDPKKEVARKYGVFRIPSTFILDRTGSIRFRYMGGGPSVEKQIEKNVEALLK